MFLSGLPFYAWFVIYIISSIIIGEIVHWIAHKALYVEGSHKLHNLPDILKQKELYVTECWIYRMELFGELADLYQFNISDFTCLHIIFTILLPIYYILKLIVFLFSTLIHRYSLFLRHEWLVLKLNNNHYVCIVLIDNPTGDITIHYTNDHNTAIKNGYRAVTYNKQRTNNRSILFHQSIITNNDNNNLLDSQKVSLYDVISYAKSFHSHYDLIYFNCKHLARMIYKYITNTNNCCIYFG